MNNQLKIGIAERDITPDTPDICLAGSLDPSTRRSSGIYDPLFVRAIVLRSGGVSMAYVIFDLSGLQKKTVQPYVQQASDITGIPVENIIWSCSHTHNGPVCTFNCYPKSRSDGILNEHWLTLTMKSFVKCVVSASESQIPAQFSRMRGFNYNAAHNRRIIRKDGWHINTWLLGNFDTEVQTLGCAAPIDPEIGIFAFEDLNNKLLAVLYSFSVHANSIGNTMISADYPGVVARELRKKYGNDLITLFMPGACGDLNANKSCEEIGCALSKTIIDKLENRPEGNDKPLLGINHELLTIPLRDLNIDQEVALQETKWNENDQEFFRVSLQQLKAERRSEVDVAISCWRIGDLVFSTMPGELFVDWGLKIRKESLFPWTYTVCLAGDRLGYLITEDAMEHGGYEGVTSNTAKVSVEGVEMLVNHSLAMLAKMRSNNK